MSQLSEDFEKLGFWESETEEENIVVFGMDFPTDESFIVITDDAGKTPETTKTHLVVACYSDDDCFIWGKEVQNWFALDKLIAEFPAGTPELLEALKNYVIPKK
ncbi:MAG: hypothetical protein RSF75_04515 [Acidaminococcaceae bacterium]